MKYILIFLVLPVLFSCEKTVDNADLPEEGSKLVVHSYAMEGTDTLFASLSYSEPIFSGNGPAEIPDLDKADVRLIKGSHHYPFTYDSVSDHFYLATDIHKGKTYGLRASTPDFPFVEGETTVPYQAPSDLDLVKQELVSNEFEDNIVLTFEFTDIANEANYYRLLLYKYEQQGPTINDSTWQLYNWVWGNNQRLNVFTDDKHEGKKIRKRASINVFQGHQRIRIVLLSTDKHYFLYHDKLNKAEMENPFSEPVIPYSNMENGLGVFAAYTKTSKEFIISH
ncbi:MAG: DUF4249 domain-containing protein [Bacteroidales bacterium]